MTKRQRETLQLVLANEGRGVTLQQALWASRLALLQWLFVIGVAVLFLVQMSLHHLAGILVAFSIGALTAQVAAMNRAIQNWSAIRGAVDLKKVRALLQDDLAAEA